MPDKKAGHARPPMAEETAAPRGPWYKNKRAQTAGKILGVLFVAAFIMWFFMYMPFSATDDARIDTNVVKTANQGASGLVMPILWATVTILRGPRSRASWA